jgi:serine kinase of HPr protein (carbohydrate metabolism regulator)
MSRFSGHRDEAGTLVHATSVAIHGHAVLLTGESGSGKSDLALRLIDRGATLVCDDYTLCEARAGRLWARTAPNIAGKMEVRYLGLVAMHYVTDVPVALAISLDDKPVRMPDQTMSISISGVDIPCVALDAREPSAAIKVELALRQIVSAQP